MLYEKRHPGKLDILSVPSQAERLSLKTQIEGDYALENKMKFHFIWFMKNMPDKKNKIIWIIGLTKCKGRWKK